MLGFVVVYVITQKEFRNGNCVKIQMLTPSRCSMECRRTTGSKMAKNNSNDCVVDVDVDVDRLSELVVVAIGGHEEELAKVSRNAMSPAEYRIRRV